MDDCGQQADPSGVVTIYCTRCGQPMRIAPQHVQVTVACPHCRQPMEPSRVTAARSPAPEPAAPASAPPPPPSPLPASAPPPVAPYARHDGHPRSARSKVVAGVLGILLGWLGVHRFYLGYVGIGVLQIILFFVTAGIAGVWGFIEGILCLTGHMRDVDGLELRD